MRRICARAGAHIVVGSNLGTRMVEILNKSFKICSLFFVQMITPLIFNFFRSGFFLLRDFRLRSADFGHILKIIRTKIVDLGRNQWSRLKIVDFDRNHPKSPMPVRSAPWCKDGWARPGIFFSISKINTLETNISQQEKTRSKKFEN